MPRDECGADLGLTQEAIRRVKSLLSFGRDGQIRVSVLMQPGQIVVSGWTVIDNGF